MARTSSTPEQNWSRILFNVQLIFQRSRYFTAAVQKNIGVIERTPSKVAYQMGVGSYSKLGALPF